MKVEQLMTRKLKVVNADATLKDAATTMKKVGTGVLPVVDHGKLVGMLTDRDITVRATAAGQDPNTAIVRDAMTAETVCCSVDEDIESAGKKMLANHVGRLPVIDRGLYLSGIISLADILARKGGKKLIQGRRRSGSFTILAALGLIFFGAWRMKR